MNITFKDEIPYYQKRERSYGFVEKGGALPARSVSLSGLFIQDSAVCIAEKASKRFEAYHKNGTDYDLGGMILRVDLSPGAHHIEVECLGDETTTLVSVSGMHPERIRSFKFWDAAELIPVRQHAHWEGNVWSYSFVNGLPYLDIEVEPLAPNTVVGIKAVRIHEIKQEATGKPTIFILGDSTAKSYVFEEAPMSAWGQCFHRVVDLSKAAVINYSNGGRSLKTMHIEGRFNDMLLAGKAGDFVLLQSGHNDERSRNDGVDPDGELIRFGGGSTEEMYEQFLTNYFLPAIKSSGMIPVLVTPVTRINACCKDNMVFEDSFTKRRFPHVMRTVAVKTDTLLLDLNKRSVEHFNQIGAEAARALVMSVEPGETPGKTNSGSYANGNPNNHADGTHYKEALSKQYCRLAVDEIYRNAKEGNTVAEQLFALLAGKVQRAAETKDFSEVFPEICKDTLTGKGAYYRNQIEKLVQVGIFTKDEQGCFHPEVAYTTEEFIKAVAMLWQLPKDFTSCSDTGVLRRQAAAEILYDAYCLRFGLEEDKKPKYMTDYNGRTIDINDPNYDSNIPLGETIYYPLTAFERLQDVDTLPPALYRKVETVYRLGIMRSEEGITRGSLTNGIRFQPELTVTRAKAAKLLYFCFVLAQDIKTENHQV